MGAGVNTSAGGSTTSASNSTLAQMLQQYSVPMPSVAEAYLRSFNRGGPLDVPSYQEMYGSYRDVAEREAKRQSASINEAFGSQGGRYSSDLLASQGRLRENLFQNLNQYSGDLLQRLRGQQFGEASALANLQYGISEAGMSRLFQDFLRRTSPPPMFDQSAGWAASFGQPTYGVY